MGGEFLVQLVAERCVPCRNDRVARERGQGLEQSADVERFRDEVVDLE
jgi:hypothetical protein